MYLCFITVTALHNETENLRKQCSHTCSTVTERMSHLESLIWCHLNAKTCKTLWHVNIRKLLSWEYPDEWNDEAHRQYYNTILCCLSDFCRGWTWESVWKSMTWLSEQTTRLPLRSRSTSSNLMWVKRMHCNS